MFIMIYYYYVFTRRHSTEIFSLVLFYQFKTFKRVKNKFGYLYMGSVYFSFNDKYKYM